MITSELSHITKKLHNDLTSLQTLPQLDELTVAYLGRNGHVNKIFSQMKTVPPEEKKAFGAKVNELKQEVTQLLEDKKNELMNKKIDYSSFDVTLPGKKKKIGSLHPYTIVRREMNAIFKQLGFSVYDGPHIETDEYVFERANLPKHHPARSLQDTIVIEDPDVILRPHTSSVENRALENESLPLRIVAPGMTFRYETPNATNHFVFNQYQGVVVAEDITMADLKGTLESFCKSYFGQDTIFRIRAKYYPEVEPGCGLDIQCKFCKGKGCSVCKGRGWVEIGGAGMIHPNMLRAAKIDSSKYSGFAWGMGFDRIVMQKFNIDDIRKMFDGTIVRANMSN